MQGKELANLVYNSRFHFSNEKELQRGLAQLFEMQAMAFEPEVDLTPEDRIDFMVETDLGVEVKVDKSLAYVTRQMFRYSKCPQVRELVLVTSRSQHQRLTNEMNGKHVYVVYLLNSFL